MARAFATFPNQGREVVPVPILYIEDRNGRSVSWNPRRSCAPSSCVRPGRPADHEPPDAYVMIDLLQSTVNNGTLRGAAEWVGGFERPMAGKTGTTQNWSDAWTVGFSPQITTAIWFGFDERATVAGDQTRPAPPRRGRPGRSS